MSKIMVKWCQNLCLLWQCFVSVFFLKKIRCARSARLRVVFLCFLCCLECLTLDPLAPAQSKRSFSIWALPSTMCNFGTPFVTFWRHLGIIYHVCKTCKSKDRKRREMSLNLGFKTGHQKVIFLVVFGVWLWRCARVAPRVPFGAPWWSQGPSQDTKSEPNGTKMESHSHRKSTTKIDKSLEN